MGPLDPEVLRGFYEEARSYVPDMERALESLTADPASAAAAEELYRLAHSVGGASRMVGLSAVGEAAGAIESMLEETAQLGSPFNPEYLPLLAEGIVQMKAALDAAPAVEQEAIPQFDDPKLDKIPADLLAGFLEESEEHLHAAGEAFRTLESAADKKPHLREIRRGIHTIKGAAGMIGLETVSKLAHRMEDLLDLLFEGRAEYSQERHELLVATYDTLAVLVKQKGRVGNLGAHLKQLFDIYRTALSAVPPDEVPEAQQAEAEPADASPQTETESSDPAQTVRAPLDKLDELVRLVGELFVNRSAFERHLAAYAREVEELHLSLQRVKRLASQLDTEHVAFHPGSVNRPSEAHGIHLTPFGAEFDSLEFDRYTQLDLLSRELNETTSDIATAALGLRQMVGAFDGYMNTQSRLTSELQDKLVRLRMVPLDSLANRMYRTVRYAAQKSGKVAELTLSGLEAELDKIVVEQLAQAFDHLLRNAVDHGLEDLETRRALGKPDRGQIRVEAKQEGTHVVIRLSDDGRGFDPAKLRAAAVRLGFMSEPQAAQAQLDRLIELIFEPGFSTATTVSELSGRGVGLDVVRSAVESLKGTIKASSEPGLGTTFVVQLPTTLAITKVLFVEEQSESYAIPLAAVTQVARVDAGQVERVGECAMIQLGPSLLPIVRLGEAVEALRGADIVAERQPLLVVRSGGDAYALAVDRILGAREVMVKPLTGVARKSALAVGATLLGDGSVVLILNPASLAPGRRDEAAPRHTAPAPPVRRNLNVMIVDDSLSVRRVVANLVRHQGWTPIQAKDGLEALEMVQLSDPKPDVILLDIEMPRMDGFELTATLRALPETRTTPIVMLTSRAGDKHRKKALALGANHFLVKPYQDETLLSLIRLCASHGQGVRVA
jgi:chemosensory pili system protein ChpA (sensor histidine kinase/response regulator)